MFAPHNAGWGWLTKPWTQTVSLDSDLRVFTILCAYGKSVGYYAISLGCIMTCLTSPGVIMASLVRQHGLGEGELSLRSEPTSSSVQTGRSRFTVTVVS